MKTSRKLTDVFVYLATALAVIFISVVWSDAIRLNEFSDLRELLSEGHYSYRFQPARSYVIQGPKINGEIYFHTVWSPDHLVKVWVPAAEETCD